MLHDDTCQAWQCRPNEETSALMCVCRPTLVHHVQQAALTASQPHLPAWHPASLTFALKVLGDMTASGRVFFSPKLQAAVTAWQHAAVAALQPGLEKLPAESLVQLLVGANRITLGTRNNSSGGGKGSSQQQQQQQPGVQTEPEASGSNSSSSSSEELLLQTVLTAAVMALSTQLQQLPPEQLVLLMVGCSSLESAEQSLGQAVLQCLEPNLRCVAAFITGSAAGGVGPKLILLSEREQWGACWLDAHLKPGRGHAVNPTLPF